MPVNNDTNKTVEPKVEEEHRVESKVDDEVVAVATPEPKKVEQKAKPESRVDQKPYQEYSDIAKPLDKMLKPIPSETEIMSVDSNQERFNSIGQVSAGA